MEIEPELPLFAYGTLEIAEVIQAITGRVFDGTPAILDDYARYQLRDANYPGVMPVKGARTTGLLYGDVDNTSLMLLDHYEGDLYERQRLTVVSESGERVLAWVYVIRPERREELTHNEWDPEEFARVHLKTYLSEI